MILYIKLFVLSSFYPQFLIYPLTIKSLYIISMLKSTVLKQPLIIGPNDYG